MPGAHQKTLAGTSIAAEARSFPCHVRYLQMVVARFIVGGEERESREVDEQWLIEASANHDNILLQDGNTYRVSKVSFVQTGPDRHARVELVAPQFARGA